MAADLEFRIGAEIKGLKDALAGVREDLRKTGQEADKTQAKLDKNGRLRDSRGRFVNTGGSGGGSSGGSRGGAGGGLPNGADFSGISRGAQAALVQVRNLIGAIAALGGALALVRQADELTTLSARLRLVTKDAEEFAAVQERVFDLAQRSRAPLSATVDLYARVANATKDANVGQETLLQVVETINQAVALSGANAQAAEAALVQLGQGLGSGTLRGEELNSVLEQTPALADAIAKGIGITRGELRKYGEEGKITSQAVIDALLRQRDAVAGQFAQLPVTVGQAATQVGNSLQRLLGVFNETTGATGGLASVLSDFAAYLSSDAVTGAIVEFAATWGNAFRDIVTDFNEALDIIRENTGNIVGTGEDLIGFLARAFRELPVNIRTSIQLATISVLAGFDAMAAGAKFVKDSLAAIFSGDTIDAAAQRYAERLQQVRQAAENSIAEALAERDQALNGARQARESAQRTREQARTRQLSTSRGTFRNQASDQQRRQAEQIEKARLDAEEKLQRDSSQRIVQILRDSYDDALISANAYYQERDRLELQSVDNQIAIERRRMTGGGAEAIKAEAEIRILEARKTDIVRQSARERAQAELDIQRQLNAAKVQQLEDAGQAEAAARLRLEEQYRDLLRRLRAEGNVAGVQIIEGLINTGVAKARFDQIKAEFDRVLQDLRARQQAIADQRATGAISGDTAQSQNREAQASAQAELQRLQAQLQAMAADPTALPAIKRGAEEAAAAIRQLAIDSATGLDAAAISLRASLANIEASFAQVATSQGVDALTNLFTDLASNSKSAGDALRDFARGFAQSMAQVAARALATYLVLQLLDTIYPGLGKAAAASMSVGVKHAGGVIGQGGPTRRVNPLVFAGAPRYHDGGIVGLKPDERPAILQTGERVLSRAQNAAYQNGQGQGGGTRIINVIDPGLVQDYMTSASGERTILNVIERNAGTVRQKLA